MSKPADQMAGPAVAPLRRGGSRRRLCCLSCLAAMMLSATLLRADGAHIAFRASSGAYAVTLFTAPEPLVSGPADLSLLVQDQATGEVLNDATVTGSLTSAAGASMPIVLTHGLASNKLLLAAAPNLPGPGSFTLALEVERPGTAPASFTTVLAVAANHRRRTTLIFALVLPLAAILLFLVNQQAKLGRRPRLSTALH